MEWLLQIMPLAFGFVGGGGEEEGMLSKGDLRLEHKENFRDKSAHGC